MLSFRLDRKRYLWWMIVLLIVLPAAQYVVWVTVPAYEAFAQYANTTIVFLIALATGARLADAGYQRWIGIVGILCVAVVLPMLIIFAAMAMLSSAALHILWIAPASMTGGTMLLLAFVIWVGTRRSASGNAINRDRVDAV
jgi:hypothetical protein